MKVLLKMVVDEMRMSHWDIKIEGDTLVFKRETFETIVYLHRSGDDWVSFVRFPEQVAEEAVDTDDLILVKFKHNRPNIRELLHFVKEEYSLWDRIAS